jgi:hypothetical protein
MSVRVLWSNRVPGHPISTGGPALANLRAAAAARRRRGNRGRLVSEHFRIESIRLDPSYTRAFAIVSDLQRVQPSNAHGHPLGRPVHLNERARIQLRRQGQSLRFRVWQIEAIK